VTVCFVKEAARAEAVVQLPNGGLVISLDPMANLVMHTLNMYGLLGRHGGGYLLVEDERAKKAVNDAIYKRIAGKERYFGGGSLNLYSPTLEALVMNHQYTQYPSETSLIQLAPAPLNEALQETWESFYRSYWDTNIDRLLDEFRNMDRQMDWAEMLHRMEQVAQSQWHDTMLILAVEATGWSALTWGGNVCIGTLDRNGDAGFVHEGLHLLLRERWAEDPTIQGFMADREFKDRFWKSWKAKYEQALVVALDAKLRSWPEKHIQRYFEGCQVGELYDVVWPKVHQYVDKPVIPLPELMLGIIQSCEGKAHHSTGGTESRQ